MKHSLSHLTHIFSILALSILISSPVATLAQTNKALPQQIDAIRLLASKHNFDDRQLAAYILAETGVGLDELDRQTAAGFIRIFQSTSPPAPPRLLPIREAVVVNRVPARASASALTPVVEDKVPVAPLLANILEVGMAKRFHLIDGNVLLGTIIKKEEDICHIETEDGVLRVPANSIMEETASILKKDDTRYVGPVLSENAEEISLRSLYGDVVISKKDIKDMDHYYGGRRVAWKEEKKRFYQGEAALTDIFLDPTAFPLPANTFYISGLSIGYSFTDRLMIRSSFGNDFMGDLNMHPVYQFYHRQTGSSEVAAAFGVKMYNHHPMQGLVNRYASNIKNDSSGVMLNELDDVPTVAVFPDRNNFYWETYIVLSSRQSLSSGRGKMGWHIGLRTNSLALDKPELNTGYSWEDGFIPFRAWGGFDYDLSKRLKLIMEVWADNGHRFRTLPDAAKDYFSDDTPFIFDAKGGDYRMVDFDFGFLYAIKETFRVGVHFQEPYLAFYWEFYEL